MADSTNPPSTAATIEAALLAMAAPFLLGIWNTIIRPKLEALEDKIGSPDLKLVVQEIEKALDAIAQAEIPKLK